MPKHIPSFSDALFSLRLLILTIALFFTQASFAEVSANLLGHWKMDETTGTVVIDSSGNANNGTVRDATANPWSTGQLAGALSLGGSSDVRVATTTSLQPASPTISAWVNINPANNDWGWIAGEGDNVGLYVDQGFGGKWLTFYLHNGSTWVSAASNNLPIFDGQWHHVAGSFDAATGEIKVYVDTVEVASSTVTGSISYAKRSGFHIGSMDGNRKLNAQIDDVRLYGQALSQSDLVEISTDGGSTGNTNLAPVVSAGGDASVLVDASIALNGSATDDGLPIDSTVTSQWSNVSGAGNVTFDDATSPSTTATFSEPGNYVLRLTATDGELSSSDDINITVSDEGEGLNLAPSVSAGENKSILLSESATLNGSASDDGLPIDSIVTSQWSKVSGTGSVTFADATNPSTIATFSSAGNYVLRLSATDGDLTNTDDVSVIVTQETGGVDITTGLIGHWALDETAGASAADRSGNGHSGDVRNNTNGAWGAGQLGGSLAFDGSDDDISVPSTASLQPTSLTVSSWIKPENNNDWGWVAGEGDNFGLYVDQGFGGKWLYFYLYNGTTWVNAHVNNAPIFDGQWHHVAATFDQATGEIKIYADAVEIASSLVAGSITYSRGSGFHIGSMRGSRHFKGRIDDVRLYDRVLDSASIAAVSNDGSTGGNEKADQTISFNPPATKTTDDAPFAISASASSALAVSFSSTTPAVCTLNGNTVMILSAGNCTINASQSGNSLYNPAPSVTKTIVIEQGEVVKDDQFISFNPPAIKTVDSEPFDISASATSGLVVSFNATTPAVCTLDGSTVTIVTTGICSITASQSGDDAFNPAGDVSKNIIIEEEDIVPLDDQFISFNPPASVTIGQEPSQLTASSTSGLTVILSSNTPAICTLDSNNNLIVVTTVAGNCSVIATQPGNELFNPAPDVIKTIVVEEAEVEKLDQTINFNLPATKTVGDAPFAISALATSELVVSFTSTTAAVCTVNIDIVTIVSAGTCSITASQAGNDGFNPAADVVRTIDIANPPENGDISINGKIKDQATGNGIADASITVFKAGVLQSQQSTSIVTGDFSLASLEGNTSYVFVIAKEGYATQSFPYQTPSETIDFSINIILSREGDSVTFPPDTAIELSDDTYGAKVSIQPNSFVDSQGNTVTDDIKLVISSLNTAVQEGQDSLPGERLGLIAGEEEPTTLFSLGAAEFIYINTVTGEEVNLGNEKTATITIPLFTLVKGDGSTLELGDPIAIWSLNESTGIWEDEGNGEVVVLASSPTGFGVQATVTHFSWWSAGSRVVVKAFAHITITGNSDSGYAEIKARTETNIPLVAGGKFVLSLSSIFSQNQVTTPIPGWSSSLTCFWAETILSGNFISTPEQCISAEPGQTYSLDFNIGGTPPPDPEPTQDRFGFNYLLSAVSVPLEIPVRRSNPSSETYTYRVISGSLPPGVSLSNDGLISGAPTRDGLYLPTVEARASAGFTKEFIIRYTVKESPASSPVFLIGANRFVDQLEIDGLSIQGSRYLGIANLWFNIDENDSINLDLSNFNIGTTATQWEVLSTSYTLANAPDSGSGNTGSRDGTAISSNGVLSVSLPPPNRFGENAVTFEFEESFTIQEEYIIRATNGSKTDTIRVVFDFPEFVGGGGDGDGLTWQDDSAVLTNQMSWSDAINYCQGLTLYGFNDWILPTREYYESMARAQDSWTNIFRRPTSNRPNTDFGVYWLSESSAEFADAYILGDITGIRKTNETIVARCVRGTLRTPPP